jgi:hypothetical protein
MFCLSCVRRLPHRIRRAIYRVNHGPDRTPQGDRDTLRAQVFERAEQWFINHPDGAPQRRTTQQPTVRYSKGGPA